MPGDTGVECSLAFGTDAGSQIEVSDIAASAPGATDGGQATDAGEATLAQNLYTALASAVAMPCFDPHGVHVQLQNVASVAANEIQFDDASNYATFRAPNILVRGPDAQAVISAFAAAGIDDCDPTRNLFIVCNTGGGAGRVCGHEWMNLVTVGAVHTAAGAGLRLGSGARRAHRRLDAARRRL